MESKRTSRFKKAFQQLPAEIQEKALVAFLLWKRNPNHPGLMFKKVHATLPIHSVRIGLHWRAVGVQEKEAMVWFWIGSHSDYNHLLSQL